MNRFHAASLTIAAALTLSSVASAQITHGKKPELPAPFATPAAGNGPDRATPPEGFLPTVPDGFHISILASGFKTPRWLAVAPNGDIFVAEVGANLEFGRYSCRESVVI